MRNRWKLSVLALLTVCLMQSTPAASIPQDRLSLEAQLFQSSDGLSTVLLLDTVHFGPRAFYDALAERFATYVRPRKNVVVLLEGVHCRSQSLVLRDPVNRWPFPQLEEIEKNFDAKDRAAFKAGVPDQRIAAYYRRTLARHIAERGLLYYFKPQPCPGAQVAERDARPREPASLANQLQTIDDIYGMNARRIATETGTPSITQHDESNPLWQKMFAFARQGNIGAIVTSDYDRSQLDSEDLDQLIWLAHVGIQEAMPPMVNSSWEYLSAVWYGINQRGFRNDIVLNALRAGIQRGHQHFVLPWGEAHHRDLAARLAVMGYVPVQTFAVPYAPCSYVRRIVGNESCRLGL